MFYIDYLCHRHPQQGDTCVACDSKGRIMKEPGDSGFLSGSFSSKNFQTSCPSWVWLRNLDKENLSRPETLG